MFIWVVHISEEGRPEDTEGEEETEGEAEEEGGEDGVGDQHCVNIEGAALLTEGSFILDEHSRLARIFMNARCTESC